MVPTHLCGQGTSFKSCCQEETGGSGNAVWGQLCGANIIRELRR